jgi:hypothetical protein
VDQYFRNEASSRCRANSQTNPAVPFSIFHLDHLDHLIKPSPHFTRRAHLERKSIDLYCVSTLRIAIIRTRGCVLKPRTEAMLAAHKDQENLAFSHQAGAAVKQQQNQGLRTLQPKTPGARYPRTPLKIPLNDENAAHGLGGKSVLRPKNNNENIATVGNGGKSSFVTPLGRSI